MEAPGIWVFGLELLCFGSCIPYGEMASFLNIFLSVMGGDLSQVIENAGFLSFPHPVVL
ncbi:MAG: hypothetical protein HQ513_09845 [Rhodospirillales bacterium]|nr:hypothetical protein [Rhodospirillales bacterium]